MWIDFCWNRPDNVGESDLIILDDAVGVERRQREAAIDEVVELLLLRLLAPGAHLGQDATRHFVAQHSHQKVAGRQHQQHQRRQEHQPHAAVNNQHTNHKIHSHSIPSILSLPSPPLSPPNSLSLSLVLKLIIWSAFVSSAATNNQAGVVVNLMLVSEGGRR